MYEMEDDLLYFFDIHESQLMFVYNPYSVSMLKWDSYKIAIVIQVQNTIVG